MKKFTFESLSKLHDGDTLKRLEEFLKTEYELTKEEFDNLDKEDRQQYWSDFCNYENFVMPLLND